MPTTRSQSKKQQVQQNADCHLEQATTSEQMTLSERVHLAIQRLKKDWPNDNVNDGGACDVQVEDLDEESFHSVPYRCVGERKDSQGVVQYKIHFYNWDRYEKYFFINFYNNKINLYLSFLLKDIGGLTMSKTMLSSNFTWILETQWRKKV